MAMKNILCLVWDIEKSMQDSLVSFLPLHLRNPGVEMVES